MAVSPGPVTDPSLHNNSAQMTSTTRQVSPAAFSIAGDVGSGTKNGKWGKKCCREVQKCTFTVQSTNTAASLPTTSSDQLEA